MYASSANTLTKLAKGGDNQVLTVNGNILSWQTPGAGADNLGDHIATQTFDLNGQNLINGADATFTGTLQAATINGTTTVISQLFNGGKFNGTEANLSSTLTANKVLTTLNVNGATAEFTDIIASNSVNGKSLLVNGNTFDLDTTFEQGSILYASSANTLTKLAKGGDNQVLTVNGNILSWQTPGAGADNLGDHIATQTFDLNGQNLINGADATFTGTLQAATINGTTTVISQLFNGGKFNGTEANLSSTLTANKVLTTLNVNGATAEFTDIIASNSVNGKSLLVNGNTFDLDTTFEQGSILYASSANTLTKLAKGGDNQVLTVNGNILSWQTPGAGADNLGDHIATQTFDLNGQNLINGADATFFLVLYKPLLLTAPLLLFLSYLMAENSMVQKQTFLVL